MKLESWLFRAWYYFRTGYALYLAFIVGFVSNLIVIFKLAIEPLTCSAGSCSLIVGILKQVFPSLLWFAVVATLVAFPIGVYAGYLHMKRTGAFAADASIATESNPYVYKVVPGKEQEVFLPLMVLTARGLSKVMLEQNMLSKEEKDEFDKVLAKAEILLQGQFVGRPSGKRLLGGQWNEP